MMASEIPFEISVQELKSWIEHERKFLLIDVREPEESAEKSIGGILIPLNKLESRLRELDPEADIIVYCQVGGRSASAVRFLRRNGFEGARNLHGGIIAWLNENLI